MCLSWPRLALHDLCKEEERRSMVLSLSLFCFKSPFHIPKSVRNKKAFLVAAASPTDPRVSNLFATKTIAPMLDTHSRGEGVLPVHRQS